MDISLETIPLIILFLVPGFVAYYTREYLSPTPQGKLTVAEVTLLWLVYSLIVVVIEGLLFTLCLSTIGYDFPFVIENGLVQTFKHYPLDTALLVSLWTILSIIGGYFLGRFDPERGLRRQLAASGLTATDLWYNVFTLRKASLDKDRCYLAVRMANGDVYYGFLSEYALRADEDGNRELILENITYVPSEGFDKAIDLRSYQEKGIVLINTRNVHSIEAIYENVVTREA
jgi:hypothetical protein